VNRERVESKGRAENEKRKETEHSWAGTSYSGIESMNLNLTDYIVRIVDGSKDGTGDFMGRGGMAAG
jgi:hypothetical protein